MDRDGRREESGRGRGRYRRDDPGLKLGRREVGGWSAGAYGGSDGGLEWLWEREGGIGHGKRRSGTGLARVSGDVGLAGGSVADGRRQAGRGMACSRARARLNCSFQGPALGKMEGQSACRAGDSSGRGKDRSSEGLGGDDLLTEGRCGLSSGPGSAGHHVYRQAGAVGGEAARGEMVQPHAVLEVAYRIVDFGVTAMIGLQFQRVPVLVGDEAVIAVGGEERQLRTGRRLHPPDDEPYRRGVRVGFGTGCRWSRPDRRRRPSSKESASRHLRVSPR